MTWILRLLGAGVIIDSLFLALTPRRWACWWGRWLRAISRRGVLPRVVAAGELVVGLYLLLRSGVSSEGCRTSRTTSAASPRTPPDRALFGFGMSWPILALFRAPLLMYRLGLGWLLGYRFLMLTHRGRKSGRVYQTVLEVVHYDPRTRESVVCSGWGTRADWYRNIMAHPAIAVETGRRHYAPTYRELMPEETYPIVVDYVRQAPLVYRPLARRALFGTAGTEEERRAHVRTFVMIAFRPGTASESDIDPGL